MESQDLFDEALIEKPRKGIHFGVFVALSLVFIIAVFIDIGVDIKTGSVKKGDWDLALMILFLPLLGMFFHLAGMRAGWVINFFYYFLITMLFGSTILLELNESKLSRTSNIEWQRLCFLFVSIACCIILVMRPIKSYFRIGKNLCVVVIIAAVVVWAFLFYAIAKS